MLPISQQVNTVPGFQRLNKKDLVIITSITVKAYTIWTTLLKTLILCLKSARELNLKLVELLSLGSIWEWNLLLFVGIHKIFTWTQSITTTRVRLKLGILFQNQINKRWTIISNKNIVISQKAILLLSIKELSWSILLNSSNKELRFIRSIKAQNAMLLHFRKLITVVSLKGSILVKQPTTAPCRPFLIWFKLRMSIKNTTIKKSKFCLCYQLSGWLIRIIRCFKLRNQLLNGNRPSPNTLNNVSLNNWDS